MQANGVGFERDIRPLFRDKDVQSMSSAFDLSSDEDVRANADTRGGCRWVDAMRWTLAGRAGGAVSQLG
jgi:hypothetical protein